MTLHLKIQSHIDGVSPDGFVEGWAVDLQSPSNRISIKVLEAGRLIASGTADRVRQDVLEAGFGDGSNGFSLSLSDDIFDGRAHQLELWAHSGDSEPTLLGIVEDSLPPRSAGDGQNVSLDRQESVQKAKVEFLEESLTVALTRIDVVENSERLLIAERDALNTQLVATSDRLTSYLNSISSSPSYAAIFNYLGNLVRTTDAGRRRDYWLDELTALRLSGPVFGLFPHNGEPGQLTILVWGSGGIGDALYLSTVVREISLLFGDCQVFVLHENERAQSVFASNPYVSDTLWLQREELQRFVQTAHALDIFDLVVEVRYAVTYTTPPLSRVPREFMQSASFRSAEWQKYVRYRWPHLNNLFANEVMARGLCKLELVGLSSLLPIDGQSEIDFFPASTDKPLLGDIGDSPYVTIHHGSDRKMSGTSGIQTKNLPTATWDAIAARIKNAGFKIVQLGEEHEQPVKDIDVDLRGKTSLNSTAVVLKGAAIHVDTEGGLVHLARSMHTRSVVAFGPTPVGFFGYPQNDNLAPPLCGNCWWTNERWSTQCPRDLPVPECMAGFSAEMIAERAITQANTARRFELQAARFVSPSDEAEFVNQAIREFATRDGRGVILLGPAGGAQLIRGIDRPAGSVMIMADTERFPAIQSALRELCVTMPYSATNIPRNTGSMDWVVAVGLDPHDHYGLVSTCRELARCLLRGGKAIIGIHLSDVRAWAELEEAITEGEASRIGVQHHVMLAPAVAPTLAAGEEIVFFEMVDVEARAVLSIPVEEEEPPALAATPETDLPADLPRDDEPAAVPDAVAEETAELAEPAEARVLAESPEQAQAQGPAEALEIVGASMKKSDAPVKKASGSKRVKSAS